MKEFQKEKTNFSILNIPEFYGIQQRAALPIKVNVWTNGRLD